MDSIPASSPRYQILHRSLDGGGGLAESATYSLVAESSGGGGLSTQSTGSFRPNFVGELHDSPKAAPDAARVSPGVLGKVGVRKLLSNDSGVDGAVVQVASVDGMTANGAMVSLSFPWVYIQLGTVTSGTDSFRYTIIDDFGGTDVSFVNLTIGSPVGNLSGTILGVDPLPGGGRLVRFVGVTGFTYQIQASTDLVNWTTLGQVVVDPSGLYQFSDLAAGSFPVRYYRSISP